MTRARDFSKLRSQGAINSSGQVSIDGIEGGLGMTNAVQTLTSLPNSWGGASPIVYHQTESVYYFWDGTDWNEILTV